MNLGYNIILNIYSILIIVIIHLNARKLFKKDSLSDKLFLAILYLNVLMLGVEILSRFDGDVSVIHIVFNRVGNFLVFLTNPILPSLWLLYVHYQVLRDEKKTRKLFKKLCAMYAVYAVSLAPSRIFGWYYYIDQDNVYHRGPYFFVPVVFTVSLLLAAFAITLANRANLEKSRFLSLIFVAVPPVIGIMLQLRFYGISFVLNSVVISLLIVFLNIQKHSMYTDHLTGVSNRKMLDEYLEERVCSCAGERGFSAILIDINNFKYINDTYGHDTGDNALVTVAKLLRSCLRDGDFVARFGGDEFCIIVDVSDESDLEILVCRIRNCFDRYNKSGANLYELRFSVGYAVYDQRSHKSAEEFLKQIDTLMYKDKQSFRNKAQINLGS